MQVEKVTQYIISWLKEYASNAGVKGFVIGVSGGIDSAVTSTLCAKTGFPTLCLEMPIHQEKNQHIFNMIIHISEICNHIIFSSKMSIKTIKKV